MISEMLLSPRFYFYLKFQVISLNTGIFNWFHVSYKCDIIVGGWDDHNNVTKLEQCTDIIDSLRTEDIERYRFLALAMSLSC